MDKHEAEQIYLEAMRVCNFFRKRAEREMTQRAVDTYAKWREYQSMAYEEYLAILHAQAPMDDASDCEQTWQEHVKFSKVASFFFYLATDLKVKPEEGLRWFEKYRHFRDLETRSYNIWLAHRWDLQ